MIYARVDKENARLVNDCVAYIGGIINKNRLTSCSHSKKFYIHSVCGILFFVFDTWLYVVPTNTNMKVI